MTRSVEIPEEVLDRATFAFAAARVENWDLYSDDVKATLATDFRAAMRHALAALPYLAPAGDGGLREALEKKLATTDGWAVANETLLDMLAAHPAAPAVPQPAVIEVTEEMVEGAAEEVWPQGGSLDQHRLVRRGLEAAFQYLPFTDVPLSLNREAVKAAIRSVIFKEFGTFGGSVDRATDAVMALTAVPQPVDREALIWAMCRADRKEPEGKSAAWLRYAEETFGRYADAVLAVLAREQEQVER